MNKVFAALLEFAFANYLSRQSQGLLHSHTVKYKQFGRMMNNYFSRRMSRRPTAKWLDSINSKRKKSQVNGHHTSVTEFHQNGHHLEDNYVIKSQTANGSVRYRRSNGYRKPDDRSLQHQAKSLGDIDLEKTTKKPLGETLRTMSCVEQEINKEFESELQAAIYYKKMADRLDAESRLLFPVTFGLFCVVYWGYYFWSDTLQEHMKGAQPYKTF